ncbi:MAG: porin [Planctomycetota bacterium]|jgi:hypothetical protein
MSRTFSLSLLAGAAISVSGTAAIADTNTNSDEVRALVSEMLNDAQTRSSLLQGGGSAGHDGHFFMASADGNFRMNVSGQVQFRWVLNSADEAENAAYNTAGPANVGAQDDMQHGFENRRTKLTFSGDAFGDWFYKVQGAFSSSGGGFGLQDAYVGMKLDDGGKLVFGQMKVPLHREELVSSKHQQTVDRSLTNEFFNAGRTQGVAYMGENGDNFRYTIGFTDGANQANTPWNDDLTDAGAFGSLDSDFAVTARGEILFSGSWDVFKDMTSAPGQEASSMLGFAAHYQSGAEEAPNNADDVDATAYTIDYSHENDGWNFFGAFSAHSIESNSGGTDVDDFGFVVQAGYYFNDDTEGFLRYDMLAIDDGRYTTGGNDEISTITFGVNHYMHGHAAKFTLDANFALDEGVTTGTTAGNYTIFSSNGIGYVGDDDADEFYIRAQLQLLF